MTWTELVPGIFHMQGGSNMGLIVRDGKGLLIDAGLDKDAARQALRAAGELGVTLEAVFITHAHADHFGGAYLLQRRTQAAFYAPRLEAAMMENPIIEPLYLFGGAAPIGELRNKFTLARPCRIDHRVSAEEATELEIGPFEVKVVPLPGHASGQVGVAAGDVLFCADAVFPVDVLQKHKVTFCVDLDETLATLKRLPDLPYSHFAPGHGPAYAAGDEIARACAANYRRLEEIRERVYGELEQAQRTSDLVRRVANHLELRLNTATAYFLTRTTILAAISSLERAGKVAVVMKDNQLCWQQA
jgi:glyoxylase-like metal-dependent hydrolase (beta-lactamase superfamily II)